jgi:hypothetical protein
MQKVQILSTALCHLATVINIENLKSIEEKGCAYDLIVLSTAALPEQIEKCERRGSYWVVSCF